MHTTHNFWPFCVTSHVASGVTSGATATGLTSLRWIKDAILAGADVTSVHPGTGIAPIHQLLRVDDGSFEEFDEVLRLFLDRGADINIGNVPEVTLLGLAHGDNFRAALIKNGIDVVEPQCLLLRSVLGKQHRTVEAILERGVVSTRGLNSVFSGLCTIYKNDNEYEFPFLHMLVAAGAQINAHRILDEVAESNCHLVLTLIGLGAHVNGGWDYRCQTLSSPLHGIFHMSREVFEILINHGADVDWKARHGFTAMMELMSDDVGLGSPYWEGHHAERLGWLIEAGASCLIRNNLGHRVSDTVRGKTPLFAGIIARAVADENWGRRKGLIFLRYIMCPGEGQALHKTLRAQTSVDECDRLVLKAATLGIVGLFRNIVSFL